MWADFWEILLPKWGHPDGVRPGPRERLERITGKLRSKGLSYAEIGKAIDGYEPDTLRRSGVNRGAQDFVNRTGRYRPPDPGPERFRMRLLLEDGSVREWPLAALAVLPRVYDPERDDAPPIAGAYNLLRITRAEAGTKPRVPVAVTRAGG